MWAVGCIVAELYGGKPLFPGNSTIDQLERVVSLTGPPSASDVASMRSEFAQSMIAGLTYCHPRLSLKQKLPTADDDTIDFIAKMLVFNPDNRPTVIAALDHPFVAKFHNEDEEAVDDTPIQMTLNDDKRYTVADYRNKVYRNLLSKLGGGGEEVRPREKIVLSR
jgi:mitogen-activated protein kinase 15